MNEAETRAELIEAKKAFHKLNQKEVLTYRISISQGKRKNNQYT